MIHYKISSKNPNSHFLEIEMIIPIPLPTEIDIQLPAWRPGRYELQNFAKNIQRFEVFDEQNVPLNFEKQSKDAWRIKKNILHREKNLHHKDRKVIIKFTCYANIQNAGSSFVDENTLYVNPVNCLPYWVGHLTKACSLEIDIPSHWKVACGLPEDLSINEGLGRIFYAKNYYQLVDSPLLASPFLQHDSYNVAKTNFNLWFLGNYQPDWHQVKADFQAFTKNQIEMMGDFPEKDYHFINWILPTPYYHGVEHGNSTIIMLGPDTDADGLYHDLLGVSSHELFHAWNICKIRPKELLPYNFTKENYFPTGFVAEGVTTYYGDLFLKRSGVFSLENYLKELETILKRHFEHDGQAWQSLIESSFDLWLDGYSPSVPNRRVSIYQKGAVVALILDLMIRQKTNHAQSLDNVMQLMWLRHGKTIVGYTLKDYQTICEEVYGDSLQQYFDECIAGNIPLQNQVNILLNTFGLSMQTADNGSITLVLEDGENENLKKWLSREQ